MPKVIRDPIWGDIKLSDEEADIVDSPALQRLRGVKQLGLAHLVYPSATHTRFNHSIGTLAAAQRIIQGLDPAKEQRLDEETQRNIRLVALLHDVGHLPFGHLLEDEAGLYDKHDKEPRLRRVLPEVGRILPAEVDDVLFGKVSADRKFVEDIVSNTICADLIDYIQRDGYFTAATGLRFQFDERFLSFMRLESVQRDNLEQTRLVIVPQKDKIRLDVITDLLQLLRYRYVLTERVTYHHAKLAASAMLVKAITSGPELSVDELLRYSDETLLAALANVAPGRGETVSNRLAAAIERRQLHKPVFRVTRYAISSVMTPDAFAAKYGTREGRLDLEGQILGEAQKLVKGKTLRDGDIVVYSSKDASMTFKAVRVLVRWKSGSAQPLREVEPEQYWESSIKSEVDAMEQRYGALWTAVVFVGPGLRAYAFELERACERILQVKNDPLLQLALAQEASYASIVSMQPIIDETGLARTAAEVSQRNPADLPEAEKKRRAVLAAASQLGKDSSNEKAGASSKGLDEFDESKSPK